MCKAAVEESKSMRQIFEEAQALNLTGEKIIERVPLPW
jgi:hypothetical protein